MLDIGVSVDIKISMSCRRSKFNPVLRNVFGILALTLNFLMKIKIDVV